MRVPSPCPSCREWDQAGASWICCTYPVGFSCPCSVWELLACPKIFAVRSEEFLHTAVTFITYKKYFIEAFLRLVLVFFFPPVNIFRPNSGKFIKFLSFIVSGFIIYVFFTSKHFLENICFQFYELTSYSLKDFATQRIKIFLKTFFLVNVNWLLNHSSPSRQSIPRAELFFVFWVLFCFVLLLSLLLLADFLQCCTVCFTLFHFLTIIFSLAVLSWFPFILTVKC